MLASIAIRLTAVVFYLWLGIANNGISMLFTLMTPPVVLCVYAATFLDDDDLEQRLAWAEQPITRNLTKDEIQLRKEARRAAVYFIRWWAAALIIGLLLCTEIAGFVYSSLELSAVTSVEHALLSILVYGYQLRFVQAYVDVWGIAVNATAQLYLLLLRRDALFAACTPTVLANWLKFTPSVRLLLGLGLSVFFIARAMFYAFKSL